MLNLDIPSRVSRLVPISNRSILISVVVNSFVSDPASRAEKYTVTASEARAEFIVDQAPEVRLVHGVDAAPVVEPFQSGST